MTEKYLFGKNVDPISCHAWNQDRSQLALSFNNHEVCIFQYMDKDWKLQDVLNQHDLRVMGIDWAPSTNRIVTCAVDRNAYVWSRSEDGKWKPTLVLLRINRAATCVKWSPQENKFAVGSGARLISICYFESENDWWVSKHIKKPIRSTVTSLDWHPNNLLLVAGSTDYKVRIYSAYIKDIEKPSAATPWGGKISMGQMVTEFKNSPFGGGWIHSVSFSSDGNRICWVGHDSTINIAIASISGITTLKHKTEFLPFLCCSWITPDKIITAGHNCEPLIYNINASDSKIIFKGKLEQGKKKGETEITAMARFRKLDIQARAESTDTVLETFHQNSITCICIYKGDKSLAAKISTSGMDNQLIIWDLNLSN